MAPCTRDFSSSDRNIPSDQNQMANDETNYHGFVKDDAGYDLNSISDLLSDQLFQNRGTW